MVSSEPLSADRVKHLEFLQTVIARLGNSSFLIKGWALTIAAAFYAVLASRLSWKLALTAFIPLLVFWLLDAYFLQQERLFRCLYDDVRQSGISIEPFSMSTVSYRVHVPLRKVALSLTLVYFYGTLVAVTFIFFVGALARLL